MATLAELLVGADAEGYESWCDDLQNNFKDHWRRAAVRTTLTLAQAGMIGDDSADNTLWHCVAPGAPPTWHQIVQTTVPVLDDLNVYFGTNSDGSVKYDEATNDAIIVGVPVTPKRGIIYCRTADIAQNFTALIGASTEVQKHIIDVDRDSTFDYGFFGDDIGLLTVPANPLRENMLTNSEIKVWSNSDTNKGLATLVYDNLAGGNFGVGNTITGATSGATGKLITDNGATSMTLGAVSGTFQDNEQISNGAGVTADVNGDAAIGVKNDPCNNDSTGLWTDDGANIALAFVAAEYSVMTDAATQRAWIAAAALIAGKLYKIELGIKDGTAATQQIEGYFNDGAAQYGAIKTTAAGWVSVSWTFECTTTTAAGLVGFRIPVSLGGLNIQIRQFSCYEITPSCTAADALAFDTWVKESSSAIDIYRQHWDATYAKDGSFYSLKMVQTGAVIDGYVRFPGAFYDKEEWYAQFQGRTVAFGVWIYASKANHCRIGVIDSVGSSYSLYHSGTPGWEWLEIARTVNAAAVSFQVRITSEASAEVNGTSIIYASQPMFVFGSSIGAGNYRPRQQEIVWLEKKINSKRLYGLLAQSDTGGWIGMNLEADSDGKLPKGARVVGILSYANDSGSLGSDCYLALRAASASAEQYENRPWGKTNDSYNEYMAFQGLSSAGDFDYYIEASGAGTFDIPAFYYYAVQVN